MNQVLVEIRFFPFSEKNWQNLNRKAGEKKMPYLPKARAENIVIQDLEKETLIYDLLINKAFCLNQTSSLVWQFCDGKNSIIEISDLMSKKLKLQISEDLVWLAVQELGKNKLLENEAELKNHFADLSRREMVRRVGLASMIALPMIASVVAPSAVQAQSGCLPDGRLCLDVDTCCSKGCLSFSFPKLCGCQPDGMFCQLDSDCCGAAINSCNPNNYCGCAQDGELCEFDVHCCSSNCNNLGICGCQQNGEACRSHTDCCNGHCHSNFICQPCTTSQNPCTVSADCCSGQCINFFGIKVCA